MTRPYKDIHILTMAELKRAEAKHPDWPDNRFEGLAILTEEVGELNQAVIDEKHGIGDMEKIEAEAIQVIAMGYRFLKNVRRTNT